MKIYIPQDIDPAGKNYLLEKGYELKMGSAYDEVTMAREIVDCDAIIVRVAKLTRNVMEAAPRLKVIGRHGVGTDNIDLAAAKELGIRVTNGPYSNTNSVAEHTLAMMMSVCRLLPVLTEAVKNGDYNMRNRVRLLDLTGKTIGLIGSGRIAQSVAKKLTYGFDAHVITWGTHHPEKLPEYMTYVSSLEELLSSSDIVSLHCPSNAASRGLIGSEEIALMKEGSFLVNTARGDIIDHSALYQALKSGKLKGAALDVYPGEVPDVNDPVFTIPNVVLTPHCASHTNESFANMSLHAAIGVDEVLSGKAITWSVV